MKKSNRVWLLLTPFATLSLSTVHCTCSSLLPMCTTTTSKLAVRSEKAGNNKHYKTGHNKHDKIGNNKHYKPGPNKHDKTGNNT